MIDPRRREELTQIFRAAVAAADPALLVPRHIPQRPKGRVVVVGAGKASAAMAAAFDRAWDGPLEGLVVTRYGHGAPSSRIEIVEASHPAPDDAGLVAAKRILALAKSLGPDDLLVAMISGGGSALMSLPVEDVTAEEKRAVNRELLRCGAAIGEINAVRKHLSAIKGGRLAAAAAPARVLTLLISDVPGDDPSAIASGPTVPDPTTLEEAVAVLRRYGIDAPWSVKRVLDDPGAETPKPGDPVFDRVETVMLATPRDALEAGAREAASLGYAPLLLGDAIEGEAREVGRVHAGIARFAALHGAPAKPPAAIISGGETTVTVRGNGRGGRNAEFLLGLTVSLNGLSGVHALACDTDGIDGSEDNAGAVSGPQSLAEMRAAGVDPVAALDGNDAYGAFAAIGDLVVTGPTLTNVNDLRVMLVRDEDG